MGSSQRIRQRQLKVFLLDEEMLLLKLKATAADMSKSRFVRNIIVNGEAVREPNFSKEDAKAIVYELNRIGNNINQIAYRVNGKGTVDTEDMLNLTEQFEQYLRAAGSFVMI